MSRQASKPSINHASGSPPGESLPQPGSGATGELSKAYRPSEHEARIWQRWIDSGAFHADPDRVLRGEARPYCVLIPPPNVTDRLHLGHALNNTLQDVLVRAHRMMGNETLWMPGTDHAGIATQAVIERRLRKEGKLKGPLREAMTRDQFVAQVQAWKDEYEGVITGQLKAMGCSCDWERQRFTMDEQCAKAVREAFFRLFKDRLIERGKRLVNWDVVLQTAVADDECYDEEIDGAFYYLRYPLVHPGTPEQGVANYDKKTDAQPVTWNELARRGYSGAGARPPEQQAWVTVATTRPETYLGDTAVAVNPHDPRAKPLKGLCVELPLVGRVIPIIEDSYVVLPEAIAKQIGRDEDAKDPKAAMATGFLKVTPAHDTNDYELGLRHRLPLVNIMAPDGTISDKHGWKDVNGAHVFVGLKREDARKKVIEEFKARSVGSEPLFEGSKPHRHSVKHSDRSKAIIEPYLSDQWYVKVTDDRLAPAANRALVQDQRSSPPGGPPPGGPPLRGGSSASALPGGSSASALPGGSSASALPGGSSSSALPGGSSSTPSTPSTPHHTLIDRLPYPPFIPSGFVGKDPYPPGQPSPPSMVKTRRFLPHIQIDNATYFVTWRLANDSHLSPPERDIVLTALRHHDGSRVDLYAASVMSNHVHCVVRCLEATPLLEWLAGVKRFTARQINAARGSSGHVWQDESFDHVIRDSGFLAEFVQYIAENPVDAGAAARPSEYPWTYVSDSTLRAMSMASGEPADEPASERRATNDCTTDAKLRFYPSRYAKTYEQWHTNIKDWCISRQLWWGHRIPVWYKAAFQELPQDAQSSLITMQKQGRIAIRDVPPSYPQSRSEARPWEAERKSLPPRANTDEDAATLRQHSSVFVCVKSSEDTKAIDLLDGLRFVQDPDVLDTWFSSALWPLSTLGWPDKPDEPDKPDKPNLLLKAFNPSSTLCTAREIITLWVSRMVMFNRYFMGEGEGRGPVPFRDVFIHAVIQDGEGRKMSKSLGNGVDPLDVIATHGTDAMRFTLCQMTTQTQDVRMPVRKDPATGRNTSEKFDLGRNFANKLWNAARFALGILGTASDAPAAAPRTPGAHSLIDRWMLSRLAAGAAAVDAALAAYEYSDMAGTLYALLWNDFCDWYLEGIKPTVQADAGQRAVLRAALDTILRLLHPVMPFVTEAIYEKLRELPVAAVPGVALDDHPRDARAGLLCTAAWPRLDPSLRDEAAEREFERLRTLVTMIRDARSSQQVAPRRRVVLHTHAAAPPLSPDAMLLATTFAGLERVTHERPSGRSVAFTFEAAEYRLSDLADEGDAAAAADAEHARALKRAGEIEKEIATLTARLNNPGYVDRAPAHMVQQTRDQLASKQAELAAARSLLAKPGA